MRRGAHAQVPRGVTGRPVALAKGDETPGVRGPAAHAERMTIPEHVNHTIEAMAGVQGRAAQLVTVHQRGSERLAGALTRPSFLYATLVVPVVWIGANLALPLLGQVPFDPLPFHYLHLVLTFIALFMATVVLVTQDRQIRDADRRGHLDLQINLLAERKVAKVIALLEELRRDLPNVRNRADGEARAMARPTNPQVVSEALAESVAAALTADPNMLGDVSSPQADPAAP